MVQLSEKELSVLNDSLSEEELLVKKFKMLASQTSDAEISSKFEEISARHQAHYNELFSFLN
jgi:rubrerythrin